MDLASDKKTYAEAVIGSSTFGAHSLSHLQTQEDEKALVLAIQQSLSSTQCDLVNIDNDSNTEFKRPSEATAKRVKVKRHRITTFESWEAEEFNPGVPRLPLGRYAYREHFSEAQRKEAIVTKRNGAKKTKRTEKQKCGGKKILDWEEQISYMQRMNRTCPPVYNIARKETMSYKCPPKLRSDNIPGAFRPPMIPEGLWSNRGTFTNRMQGSSRGRDTASKDFSVNSCAPDTQPQTKENNSMIRIAAGGEDVTLDPTKVELGRDQIGIGSTSRVFKGHFRRDTGSITEVACKEYMVNITPKHKVKLLKEIKCLKNLRHPNILYHFGVDFTRSLLVTELLEMEIKIEGEVTKVHNARELLDLHELQPVPWSIRLHIMYGVTSGLAYLHNHNIVHCDLKAANVFIGHDGEGKYKVKLGDFGMARFDFEQFSVSILPSNNDVVMGTAAYTAPELLERGTKPSFESDMYSLGMVMTEFSLPDRSTPWEGELTNTVLIYDYIRRGERPTVKMENLRGLSDDIARLWMRLLYACWDQDPSKRPSATDAHRAMMSICVPEPEDNYKAFEQWSEENPDSQFVPLGNHQGMALELMDEVVSSFTSQNKSISEDLKNDLASNFQASDGSNSCVYLCTKIADELLNCEDDSAQKIASVAEETIRSLPKHVNRLRKVSDYADVYDALHIMNQHAIINTQYSTTEILAKQSSDNLVDKQRHLKSALKSLEESKNAEGKAFAVYTCNPLAVLVGVVRSTFIIIDTHKVHQEVGGKESGLLVLFNLESIRKDDVLDGIVDWISLRMRRAIKDYSTKLHSLVHLQPKSDVRSVDEDEFAISDTEDLDVLNASIEIERNLQSIGSNYCVEVEEKENDRPDTEDLDILNASIEIERHLQSIGSNDFVEVEEKESDRPQNEKVNKIQPDITDHKIRSRVWPNSSESTEKDYSTEKSDDTADYLMMKKKNTQSDIADAAEVERLYIDPEMERSEGSPTSNTSNKNAHGDFTLPEELPNVKEDDLIIWKGHLTKFGLNSLNDFQIQAIQSVQLGRDVIVVQPTGSGKSLCFQLPSLFEREKFVVVITPTISLINSQIEGLKKVNIDAIALGRPAGQDAQLNHDRLFNSDNVSSFPSIVFTTPEHFVNRVCYNLERIKTNVKLMVWDEVHKMFDRNSDFRSSYDFFKGFKESFSCVPVMTLTATLSQAQLQSLCTDYLKNPVLIKGSINRSNIKLNIKSYVTSKKKKTSRSAVKENTKEDIWSECAMDIKNISGDEYAIVYMDFRSDVELMTSSLKRLLGEENVKPYYGRGMTHEVKKKTDSAFRGKEFQVLVATESYEVGTHSPHVDNIFRVGCMRNLSVMVQEFGRAGRSGNNADGFLLINESKDDQRLAFWTKNCSKSEEEQIKAQLIQSWRWVYSIYCGRCMREEIISKFGEGQLELQCVDACCSSCDIKDERDFNAKEAVKLVIQAVLDLGQVQTYKEGVKEEVLIGWLRGSKKDTFSLPEIQEIMEQTQTYSAGSKTFEDSSQGWWSRVLRQAIHLQLIDLKFNILRCKSFTRVWRQYKVSEKGKQFLDSPYDILVLNPINDPLDQSGKQKEVVTRARTGRGHHHLPKIKDCLRNSADWIELTLKDQYEFPGFGTASATSQTNFLFVKDYRKLNFAPSTRPHFIWEDNQLSKRSTQRAKHNIVIDGVDTSLNVRRGPCEGVKKCAGPDCSYVVSNRQKVNRCVQHKDSHSLVSTGPCPAHMVYIWPVSDDGRRWIGVVPGTQHNHSKPAPHILSSKVKEDIRKVVSGDSTKSTKDIMKGFGIGYVPAEASSPAANADRVRRERKMALGKWMSFHKELRPLDEILGFDKIRKKVEGNQLYDEGTNISEKVNKMMGQYQMEGSEYIFTPERKYAFFMSPFQSNVLSKAEDLFVDVTYTGNDSFPYLLNIVTFNDLTCVYNAVARVLCSRQDGETYAKSITTIFNKVTRDHGYFSNGARLRSILVDFDDAQYKGLKECLGDELAKKVIRGCSVHWQRSVNRVCKLVCQSEDETRIFKTLALKIEEERDKENVYLIFDVLSGSRKLQDAKHFMECDISSALDKLDNHSWTKLKHWSKWWCRLNHLAMFTRAFKEMDEKDWEEGPRTTNPVEALNRQSLQEGCTVLHTLMENIYLEDRLQAVKTAVSEDNVTTSYRASPGKPKSKRKRTSIGNSGDEGPPDKRRHIISQKRRPNGRALINRLVEVEYDEKDNSGKVTKYWGWCKGQIVAYRKHEGYLIKFEDRTAEDGTVVAGWSDWIADLNSKDVRLLDS